MKRTYGALVLAAFCALGSASAATGKAAQLIERISKLLGLDQKSVSKATRVRGGDCEHSRFGSHLLRLSCERRREDVLWTCGGCSSPVGLPGGGVAAVKADGVWVVSGPERARRLTDGGSFLALLGVEPAGGPLLAVAGAPDGGPALVAIDLSSGAVAPVVDPAVEQAATLLPNLRPGAVQGDRVLKERLPPGSLSTSCAREVRLATGSEEGLVPPCEYAGLDGGTWDRFDPAWAGRDIVYAGQRL